MNSLSEKIIDILSNNIQQELLYESIVFWDQNLLQKGDIVKAGYQEYKIPFRGYHIFVDLMPKANWGHPVLHLFIDDNIKYLKIIKDQFPPWFGELPESVIVLYRYGKLPKDVRNPDPFGEG